MSDSRKLHDWLCEYSFSHAVIEVKDSTRRYVKRGFYDGDFPDAYHTSVHSEEHLFGAHVAKAPLLHKFLVRAGYSCHKYKIKTQRCAIYRKGKNSVATTITGVNLVVRHTFESTTPVRGYIDRGQII